MNNEHNNAPAVPQGYEIHEIPADYSGLVWLEGQVRAVARRAQTATGPQGWTDADSDAARLALELECLLMDTKDLSVVSKWWGSANEALELHRQRLAATPAPAPAQGKPFGYFRAEPFGWTDCSEDAEGAIALYEHPAQPAQEVGLTDAAGLSMLIAGALFDFGGYLTTHPDVIDVGSTALAGPVADRIKVFAAMRGLSLDDAAVMSWSEAVAALRAKGAV